MSDPKSRRKTLIAAQKENEGWVDVLTWVDAYEESREDGYEREVRQAYANMGISYA